MRVEFLGTAGFHPNAQRHTSGIFLPAAAPADAFLLDAGTGTFRLIGRELPPRLHIFLSHAHLDHTAGLTFLLDVASNRDLDITLYGDAATLDCVKRQLFDSPLFPLPLDYPTHEIEPGAPFEVAGVEVRSAALTHPGGSLAFRFDWSQKSLAYVTDTAGDDSYFSLIQGVDFLIHERNFSDNLSEIAQASGHCTSRDLVRAARFSEAKVVVATHFNPLTSDDPLLEDDLYNEIPGVIGALDEMCLDWGG